MNAKPRNVDIQLAMHIKQSVSLLLILPFFSPIALSQTDSSLYNSFESIYKKRNPTLNYKYDRETQIHDYSNNWDLDNDNKPDQLYFVGTGGAHLYYFLRVILSSDSIVKDYSFIESDFPVLPSEEDLKKPEFKPEDKTLFAVFDDGNNNTNDIYIRLDQQSFYASRKDLKKKGVKTCQIIITFKKGRAIFRDLVNLNETKVDLAIRAFEDVDKAIEQIPVSKDFFILKKKYDPLELFQTRFYQTYK